MYRGRKVYGQSAGNYCMFCGKTALSKNAQGLMVCLDHKNKELGDLKCACGSWLDIRSGKWGAYALCESCGPQNLKKALSINETAILGKDQQKVKREDEELLPSKKPGKKKPVYYDEKPKKKTFFGYEKKSKNGEITVTSDELDFL